MRKILACILAACLLAGLLPMALAAEAGEHSVLSVPVEWEGADQSGEEDRAQLFTLVDEEDYVYCYQGTEWWYSGKHITVTPSGDKPDYGYFHMLNASGTEVAVSGREWLNQDSDTNTWYGSSVHIEDMSQVAPGEYTIRMTDDSGKEYACPTKLKVVAKGALMLSSISVQTLRPGQAEFEVSIAMYGFQRETDLTNLTVTLKDTAGTAVARSTGSYRINSQSDGHWYFYEQMKTLAGQTVKASTSYTLELAYPGSVELINAAGAATAYSKSAGAYIASARVADPATGKVAVELKDCTPGTAYRVVASKDFISYLSDLEKRTVYASAEVTATAATATVTLPMTLNGKTVSMAAYPSSFGFTLFGPGSDYHLDSLSNWSNPYGNNYGAEPWINFRPYYVKTSTKTLPFTIECSACGYWKGSGDVLTVTDKSGRELGRCAAMTAVTTNSGNQMSITGTLNITGTLQNDTYYNVALNGVEFGGLRAVSGLAGQMGVGSGTYIKATDSYDFWTNLGQLLLSADMIHSSGSGHFELVNASGQTAVTGPTVTGSDSEYYDHKHYACGISAAEAQSKLTDGAAYQFWFVDANGSRAKLSYNRDMVYRAGKVPFTLDNAYLNWWSMKPGDTSAEGQLYTYNFRHAAWAEVETALKGLTLVSEDGSGTLTVTSVTRVASQDDYQQYIAVELSGPVTAGTWQVQYQGVQRNTFTVSAPTDAWQLYNNVNLGAVCAISGRNLPTGGSYTARVFLDYQAATSEFALTLKKADSGSNDALEFPRSVIASLGEGSYRVRVYRDGKVLGEAGMYLPAKGHVAVELYDEELYYQSNAGMGNALIESGRVGFHVTGDSGYIYLRCAESRAELTKAEYILLTDWYDGYTLSDGEGEKTLYVQLKHVDGSESQVIEAKAWRMEHDPVLTVPSSVGGVCVGDSFTVTASSDFACLNAYVEFLDANGNPITTSGNYTGKYDLAGQASGSKVTYSRTFDLSEYSGEKDLAKAVQVRVQLCVGTGSSYNQQDMGQPVTRSVRFVDPQLDFGSRPSSYESMVAIYDAQGRMIWVDTDPSVDWEGKYTAPEAVWEEMAYAKLFALDYSYRPSAAAARAELQAK